MSRENSEGGPVVLFDGVCNLCNGFVRFIVPRDPEGTFRFAPLQSESGRELLERFDLTESELDSVVLVEGQRYYTKSTACLRILDRLGGVYAWLSLLRVVPEPVRDAVYDAVARHRYRLFGRKSECTVPAPEVRARFLD